MRARDRFPRKLFEQTGGRTDRTVHALLHVARPLALSPDETRAAITALIRDGLIGVDPMFDRLIWLTPAGLAACTRPYTIDVIADTVRNAPHVPAHLVTTYESPLYDAANAAADQ